MGGKNRKGEEDRGIRSLMKSRIEMECIYQREKKRGEIDGGENRKGAGGKRYGGEEQRSKR